MSSSSLPSKSNHTDTIKPVDPFYGSVDSKVPETEIYEEQDIVKDSYDRDTVVEVDSATITATAATNQLDIYPTDQPIGFWKKTGLKLNSYFPFIFSKRFAIIFVHGQILSLCIVSTNTLTTFMSNNGVNIPAFQSLFVYVILALIFVPYTIYKHGFLHLFKQIWFRSGWKYFILAFADVQGNYFIVKAYNYTNLLSASLLDNLAIVFVVILSFLFLKVRYHWAQCLGIIVCIGGSVVVVVSDLLTDKNWAPSDPLKGDLFVVLSAFCYGLSNVLEEFLVSKAPVYEVVGQLGFFGTFIIGVQCAIFERGSMRNANWQPKIGGYLTGYTLSMLILYCTAPILFRMSSSAFYNLSLLTSDFWSLIIGIRVFGYYVFWLYPVGFVCIIIGVIIYHLVPKSRKTEANKPWLGENQELGVSGFGTAKRDIERKEQTKNNVDDDAKSPDEESSRPIDF
ncbi:uncharacterized protein SAPINGB_P002249 [Magnusiomyces paraingens]|uniref:EamA domain-containing protein n=1 Tax=Magnusiomyces paraingens TaxID=2606893 RepID=A0A5E8BEB4_9ASCO|nr:uncharacterized protein SAPINGB_P002249 [Saprochaete ingens]VVT49394.1 unnamed protein product [Saprochaete ingens]